MPRGRVHTVLFWIGVLVLVPVAVGVFARATGFEAGPLAILVSLMPWVALASVVPLTLAVLSRSWILVAAAGVLAAIAIAWQVPIFVGSGGGEPQLVVASVNMQFGEGDADAIVALVADQDVDVLSVQELTPEGAQRLADAGLDEALPFSEVLAEPGVTGTGLWSRLPLSDAQSIDGFFSREISATIAGPTGDFTMLAVHPRAPGMRGHGMWEEELALLHDVLADVEGPAIAAGDFNTTRDHEGFRAIESLGYEDAADQAGTGFAPTFPVNRELFPFVVIDHVIERDTGLKAIETRTFTIDGADHKALVAVYAAQ